MRILLTITCLILIAQVAYGQEKKKRVGRSHLSVTPGLDIATMQSQDTNGTRVNFPQGTNWRLGAEFEIPFPKRKWTFLIEPTYQHYSAGGRYPLKYSSIETPMGFRRYFTVGKSAAIFANGMFVLDIPLTYSLTVSGYNFVTSGTKTNFAFGAGVTLRRLTLEYRYYTQRSAKDNTDSFTFNYNKRSIIFGYRLY